MKPKHLKQLNSFGLDSKETYVKKAFSRNIGLFTEAEQNRLFDSTIAISGMGGVGGVHLITLVRTGIGRFHIADFDTFEPANINRQFGARVPDLGRPKMEVMKEQALSINPFLEIREFSEGINENNIDEFLDGVQVVLDGLDFFAFDVRRMLFNKAREKGIYVVTAGPMGFSSALLVFSPQGMGFDEYFNVVENMAEEDMHLAFGLGLAPRPTHIKYMDLSRVDMESKAGPSLNIACQVAAGMAATETVRIILNKGRIKPAPHYYQFDPYLRKYRRGKLYMGNRNPVQRVKLIIVKKILKRNKPALKQPVPKKSEISVASENIPEEIIRYILQAGIQAPSGDNCQPWKFKWSGKTIELFLDESADKSFFNVNQIASIISCGAVIENMKIAATRFGIRTDVSLLPDPEHEDCMAAIELSLDSPVQEDPLAGSIWKRCTNRKMYQKRPLSPDIFEKLKTSVKGFKDVQLHFIADRKSLKKLAWVIYKVDRIRTEYRPLHEHLNSMIRWTPEEALGRRDGFYIKNLEAGIAGEVFLKMTRTWWIMNLMNRLGMGRLVALHSHQGIVNSSCAGLLTVKRIKTDGFLRGGQMLEHLWLTATASGIALQPMTAVTLFWMRWVFGGEKAFHIKHRDLLNSVWQSYRALFPMVDFSKHAQIMLFRVGYGQGIRCGTLRQEMADFLNCAISK